MTYTGIADEVRQTADDETGPYPDDIVTWACDRCYATGPAWWFDRSFTDYDECLTLCSMEHPEGCFGE